MKFDHQIVWITGASSGIGEALAKVLAKRGARLILSARREAELKRVRDEIMAAGTKLMLCSFCPLMLWMKRPSMMWWHKPWRLLAILIC